VAVGQGAFDLEGRGDGDEKLPGERAADDVDERGGQVREVAEGLVLNLFPDAEGAAEQVGGIGLALVVASGETNTNILVLVATKVHSKQPQPPAPPTLSFNSGSGTSV
jgi:hypothetical protein